MGAGDTCGDAPSVSIACVSQTAIQPSILNRLGKMCGGDALFAGEVGNRAGDAQDLVVGPGGEAQFADRLPQDAFAVGVDLAVLAELARGHPAVGDRLTIAEALLLNLMGPPDLLPHRRAAGPRRADHQHVVLTYPLRDKRGSISVLTLGQLVRRVCRSRPTRRTTAGGAGRDERVLPTYGA